jgi:hypothetical protein
MVRDGVGRSHPRLFQVIVAGVVLIGIGAVVAGVNGHQWGFRIGVLGALCLVFAGAGYVSVAVFDHRPDP